MTEPKQEFDWQSDGYSRFEIGSVVSQSFVTIKARFAGLALLSFTALAIPMGLSYYVVPLMAGEFGIGTGSQFATWPYTAIVIAEFIIQSVILPALLIHMCLSVRRTEIDGTIPAALAATLSSFWPLILSSVIFFVGIILGVIMLIVPGVILYCGWFVIFPVIFVEKQGGFEALKRSWALSDGQKWSVLGVPIISFVITVVIGFVTEVMAGSSIEAGAAISGVAVSSLLITSIGAAIGSVITSAIIAETYIELRRVQEGVVGEHLADIFD